MFTDIFNSHYIAEIELQVNEQIGNIEDPPELVPEPPVVPGGRDQFDTNIDLGSQSDPGYWTDFIRDSDLQTFKQQAYSNRDGLAIRYNPITGYKELFIAGTRSKGEWAQNVTEAAEHGLRVVDPVLAAQSAEQKAQILANAEGLGKARAFDPTGAILMSEVHNVLETSEVARDEFAAYIDELIQSEGIQVVYGHSRGAATASGLKSNVTIVGLDGAMFIAHPDADFLNITQPASEGFAFDTALQGDYKNTLTLKKRAFHDVTRARAESKRKRPEPTASSESRARARAKRERPLRTRKRVKILDKAMGRMSKSEATLKMTKAIETRKRKKIEKEEKDRKRIKLQTLARKRKRDEAKLDSEDKRDRFKRSDKKSRSPYPFFKRS